jgi:hypothetical protein
MSQWHVWKQIRSVSKFWVTRKRNLRELPVLDVTHSPVCAWVSLSSPMLKSTGILACRCHGCYLPTWLPGTATSVLSLPLTASSHRISLTELKFKDKLMKNSKPVTAAQLSLWRARTLAITQLIPPGSQLPSHHSCTMLSPPLLPGYDCLWVSSSI